MMRVSYAWMFGVLVVACGGDDTGLNVVDGEGDASSGGSPSGDAATGGAVTGGGGSAGMGGIATGGRAGGGATGSGGDAGIGTDGGAGTGGADGGSTGGGDGGVPQDSGPPGEALVSHHGIAAGNAASVALDTAGRLWTWGDQGGGFLGTGEESAGLVHTGDAYAPTVPVGLSSVTFASVAAGWEHVVALEDDGTVWSWGTNDWGQVGNDNEATDALAPVALDLEAAAVSAGHHHSLAVDTDGDVWAWGRNDGDQLGDASGQTQAEPVRVDRENVPADLRFVDVAGGGGFSVALAENGTVWIWGSGANQLGLGGQSTASRPTQVADISGIVSIAAGQDHVLALDDLGGLWAWGLGGDGRLGRGSTASTSTPVPVDLSAATAAVVAIRAGGAQSYALLGDGTVLAWGDNEYSQTGMSGADVDVPTPVAALSDSMDVAAFREHGVAVTRTGGFESWGRGGEGRLGNGASDDVDTPAPTRGPTGALPLWVSASRDHVFSFVGMDNGELWVFGATRGELGTETAGASPFFATRAHEVFEAASREIVDIAGAEFHVLALDSEGEVWAWGSNNYGRLGDGTGENSDVPIRISIPALPAASSIAEIAVTDTASFALDTDGHVWAWGRNNYGQLGIGTTSNSPAPVQVLNPDGNGPLASIVEIDAGHEHVVARTSGGSAYTWGLGGQGRLCNTPQDTCTTSNNACNTLPQQVCDAGTDHSTCTGLGQFLTGIDEIAAGGSGTYLRVGGTVLACGSRSNGQIGDGGSSSTTHQRVPRAVDDETGAGSLSGIVSIEASDASAFAVANDGTVYAWGDNSRATLGVDPATTAGNCGVSSPDCRTRPAPIPGLSGVTITTLRPGFDHVLALDSQSRLWAWGSNDDGECGHMAVDSIVGRGRMSFEPRLVTLLPH